MARSRSRSLTALGAATLLAPLSLLLPAARADMVGEGPAPSTWVGTATLSPTPEHRTDSDGDLWPTCWSADGDLYSAWGDGHGFGGADFVDIGTARITGDSPDALSGENLATGDAVVPHPWTANHSRKPTGMMCEGSTLYLAVQDLAFDFNDAPAATIVKSTDGGRTWAAKDTAKPMFSDEEFTTIWFADFGKGGEWNDSKYAYAYATDHNWRGQGDVYLARVPKDRVDDRGAWEFYTGSSKKGDATFSKKIEQKVPVLSDHRLNYNNTFIDTVPSTEGGIISQGGTLYNKALDRYILSSWSWGTQHFYESPTPWGPWTEASYHDMTRAAEQDVEIWGYGISLLSKFMSEDGRSMQMQSNQCCGLPNANPNYNFNLRTYTLTPLDDQVHDDPTGEDLATLEDAVPISKSVFQGDRSPITDGDPDTSVTDWDNEVKNHSWWGVEWPTTHTVNQVEFTTGAPADDGGWYVDVPWVEVRVDGEWKAVPGQTISPAFDPKPSGPATYTVDYLATEATGVRIMGNPGGQHRYTSMAEFGTSLVPGRLLDGGFEATGDFVNGAWRFDGTSARGIDTDCCSNTGTKNAWMRTSEDLGRQLVTQRVAVTPGETYTVGAQMRSSEGVSTQFLGARWEGGDAIETLPVATDAYEYRPYTSTFTVPDGVTSVEIVAGYSADGGDNWTQVDDVTLTQEE